MRQSTAPDDETHDEHLHGTLTVSGASTLHECTVHTVSGVSTLYKGTVHHFKRGVHST